MMSVGENVAFGLARRGVGRAERGKRSGDARAGGPGRRRGQARRGAVGRPASARGHRPQPGAGADAAAAGRAAGRARSEAARAHEDRAQAVAGRLRHDLRLHHPRPVRGAGAVGSRRRDESRPLRAARHPAGAVLPPANGVRGRASSAPTTASSGAPRQSTARSWRSPPRDGWVGARAGAAARSRRAMPVEAFIRPEVAMLARSAAELPPGQPRTRARCRACCSTARTPRCCCRSAARREFRVALPQTGQLSRSEAAAKGVLQFRSRARGVLRSARRCGAAGCTQPPDARWHARLAAGAAARAGAAVARCARSSCRMWISRCCRFASGSGRANTSPAWRSTGPSSPSRCTGTCSCAPRSCPSIATAFTLLLAFPIAWTIAKLARGAPARCCSSSACIPFWVSETVRTLGWMILLRESGVLPALLVQARHHRACRSNCCIRTRPSWWVWCTPRCCSWWCRWCRSLESLDDSLIEAAYDLGAERLRHSAHDRDPACGARHHRRLHRGVHADARAIT